MPSLWALEHNSDAWSLPWGPEDFGKRNTLPWWGAGDIYLCRNKRHTLSLLLKPDSLVILGGRKHWWPSAEEKLARALSKDGHQVVFVESR